MASSMELNKTDEENYSEDSVKWINIIFFPFHCVLKFLVLVAVILKCVLGPMSAVYPFVKCTDAMDRNVALSYIRYFYTYFCDPIYLVDTFLHVMHRQVKEEATKREHLPKSAFLILLDIISIIPLLGLTVDYVCPKPKFWPNILAFNELLVIYRIAQYFNLGYTHSMVNLVVGILLILFLVANALTCALLLITMSYQGLCSKCNTGEEIYDWRASITTKYNSTTEFLTYLYGITFVISLIGNKLMDETRLKTIKEFKLGILGLFCGYLLWTFVFMPKFFTEGLLRARRICGFNSRVKRIIEETRRRNPNPAAYKHVERFYSLMWEKRQGITHIPYIMAEFPSYLRLDIKTDMVWAVFKHSPTLRKTSIPLKRWLCEHISLQYKLPGERFFVGSHCFTNLYYIKSGILQLFSTDDNTSAVLSVTSGTLFGDINFIVPPAQRKIIVRCLTFCEVFVISRLAILKSLHMFPEDRRNILSSVEQRLKHARTLYACKKHIRGVDRTEDEGLAWIKRRWWEISTIVSKHQQPKKELKCFLPAEESYYHCAKYIGQLVLCTESQLQESSMFIRTKFPWIIRPRTVFGVFWDRLVVSTVWVVLIVYPPYVVKLVLADYEQWFVYVQYCVNLIYVMDIFISLSTAVEKQGFMTTTTSAIIFSRFKDPYFIIDLLALPWIEYFISVIGLPAYYHAVKLNRLLKIYMLVVNRYIQKWTEYNNPSRRTLYKITLLHFIYFYAFSCCIYLVCELSPYLDATYFLGDFCISNSTCPEYVDVYVVVVAYIFESIFPSHSSSTMYDTIIRIFITIGTYIIFIYTRASVLPVLYLKYWEKMSFQHYVYHLKKYYTQKKIHPNLMRRLSRYLDCQWKYYHGRDVLNTSALRDEPYDIYYKLQGEIAEKIIGESEMFKNANPQLVRELANKSHFLILPKNSRLLVFGVEVDHVSWILNGLIRCEFQNNKNEIIQHHITPGQLVCLSALFLSKVSIRTYITVTTCELLYIRRSVFYNVLSRYPVELAHFDECTREFSPVFDEMYNSLLSNNKNYQKELREKIFNTRLSTTIITDKKGISRMFMIYRMNPESNFIKNWMLFRVIIVFLSIICAALQGGYGSFYRKELAKFSIFFDAIGVLDMIIKLFMPYYDDRGLIITDPKMCARRYLTRSFCMDFIGTFPIHRFVANATTHNASETLIFLCQTFCKVAHIYIVNGYFEYLADTPTINSAYLTIFKWQIMLLLVMVVASHYYITKCVDYIWEDDMNLHVVKLNSCWYPSFLQLDDSPTASQLHLLFAKSFTLIQSGFLRNHLGRWNIVLDKLSITVCFLCLGVIFWYCMCYCQTLLVLCYHGNTIFVHGVDQLQTFLKSERVERVLIHRVVNHFTYWWFRTKGLRMQPLLNERIGIIFRQDLNYFFYKSTITAANSMLKATELTQRHMATHLTEVFFLPDEPIAREMHLTPWVFFVKRGKVRISKDGRTMAILTKGAMFGLMTDNVVRPIKITATAAMHTDVLMISMKQFHDSINKEILERILCHPQSSYDFMNLENPIPEDPFDKLEYLQERRTIKFPWMKERIDKNEWYRRWLYFVWFILPISTCGVSLLLGLIDKRWKQIFINYLIMTDVIRIVFWFFELFTVFVSTKRPSFGTALAYIFTVASPFFLPKGLRMELRVVDGICVYYYVGYKQVYSILFFFEFLSLTIPIFGYITKHWEFHLARLFRIYSVFSFYQHFCNNFQTRFTPLLLKISLVALLLHTLTCGWIYASCRIPFPLKNPKLPDYYNRTVDFSTWLDPSSRNGCRKATGNFVVNGTKTIAFFVPTNWLDDYTIAFLYIVILMTGTNMDIVVPATLNEEYYRIFVTIILYILDLWISSVTISAIFTKYREMYLYDYEVLNLIRYLKFNGLTESLIESVKKYTRHLWQRQEGCWLPEITQQAPACLREDIMVSLYMHHLHTLPLFKNLPNYFLQQLSTRLSRVVIYPGKYVVKEGDISSCIFFIHEGEVEKWYKDVRYICEGVVDTRCTMQRYQRFIEFQYYRGEKRLSSVLTVNGYFGLIAGLFPNVPFRYTYYTRTVVDLVTLKHMAWKDLIDSYPDIKEKLYGQAMRLRRN